MRQSAVACHHTRSMHSPLNFWNLKSIQSHVVGRVLTCLARASSCSSKFAGSFICIGYALGPRSLLSVLLLHFKTLCATLLEGLSDQYGRNIHGSSSCCVPPRSPVCACTECTDL